MTDQKYISVNDAAKATGLSDSTIKRRIRTLSDSDFQMFIKVETTGKKKKYLISPNLIERLKTKETLTDADRSMTDQKNDDDQIKLLTIQNDLLQDENSHLRKMNADLLSTIDKQTDALNKLSLITGYQARELSGGDQKEDQTDKGDDSRIKTLFVFWSIFLLLLFALLVAVVAG